jgi:hypothetical protein
MSDLRKLLSIMEDLEAEPEAGDVVELELGDTLIETTISEILDDGVVIHIDEDALRMIIDAKKQLTENIELSEYDEEYDDEAGMADNNIETLRRAVEGLDEIIQPGDNLPEWCQEKIAVAKGMLVAVWDYMRSEQERGAKVDEASSPAQQAAIAIAKKEKAGEMDEAKYQGREVKLGKPMAGDVKKSKVYVRGPKGNVVKVNFGDKNMRIKKSIPGRRKSFRARHNCDNPGPRWKARYWSCRAW